MDERGTGTRPAVGSRRRGLASAQRLVARARAASGLHGERGRGAGEFGVQRRFSAWSRSVTMRCETNAARADRHSREQVCDDQTARAP